MANNRMPDDPVICVPSDVDLKLRLGLFRLLQRKYHPVLGDQSKFLVAAMLNWAFAESPANNEANKFLEANGRLIEKEAGNMHLDAKLACALSVLYSFTLIWLGPTDPEKSSKLVERASHLNILILSATDMCPTDDGIQFLAVIDEYANRLLEE